MSLPEATSAKIILFGTPRRLCCKKYSTCYQQPQYSACCQLPMLSGDWRLAGLGGVCAGLFGACEPVCRPRAVLAPVCRPRAYLPLASPLLLGVRPFGGHLRGLAPRFGAREPVAPWREAPLGPSLRARRYADMRCAAREVAGRVGQSPLLGGVAMSFLPSAGLGSRSAFLCGQSQTAQAIKAHCG